MEIFADVPSLELPKSRLTDGLLLVDALVESKLASSKSEARRTIEQGGAYVNNRPVTELDRKADGGRLGERIGHCAAIWKKRSTRCCDSFRETCIADSADQRRWNLCTGPGRYGTRAAQACRSACVCACDGTERLGHSITYLTPLLCKQIFEGERLRGYAVEGSPADCVKLAVSQLIGAPVDLVVSGIQWWLECRYQCVVFRHGSRSDRRSFLPLEQLCCVARV